MTVDFIPLKLYATKVKRDHLSSVREGLAMHPLFSRFYYAYKVRPAGRFGYAQTRAVRPSDRERR